MILNNTSSIIFRKNILHVTHYNTTPRDWPPRDVFKVNMLIAWIINVPILLKTVRWCHSPVPGDFGHGRRHESVLPVRRFIRRAELGFSPTVLRRKFLACLSVWPLLPVHPSDGRPRPESALGAWDELPGFYTEQRRLRNRAQCSRARRVFLIVTLMVLSTTWWSLRGESSLMTWRAAYSTMRYQVSTNIVFISIGINGLNLPNINYNIIDSSL